MDIVGIQQFAINEVDREHLAGTQTPFANDVFFIVVVDAHLRRDGKVSIFGDDVARGAQPVTIQAAGRIAPIGQHNARRSIPRLLLTIVELIEGPHIRIDIVDRLPGRWHQDAHSLDNVHPASAHDLKHVVEA